MTTRSSRLLVRTWVTRCYRNWAGKRERGSDLRVRGSQLLLTSRCFITKVGWLCWGLTSQSTIFQSCRDGAIASWVINQYFRGVKCLAQGHNTAEVGLEPRTSRSGVRHSTTEPPRSPYNEGLCISETCNFQHSVIDLQLVILKLIHVIFSWAQIGRSAIFGREIGVPDREIFLRQKIFNI